MAESAVLFLLYSSSNVFISGIHNHGADEENGILLISDMYVLVSSFMFLKFSKMVVGVFDVIVWKLSWKLEEDMWLPHTFTKYKNTIQQNMSSLSSFWV